MDCVKDMIITVLNMQRRITHHPVAIINTREGIHTSW